jgi:hypothetical protein
MAKWTEGDDGYDWAPSEREEYLATIGPEVTQDSPAHHIAMTALGSEKTRSMSVTEIKSEMDFWLHGKTVPTRLRAGPSPITQSLKPAAFELETGAFVYDASPRGGKVTFTKKGQGSKEHRVTKDLSYIQDRFFSGDWVIEDGPRDPGGFGRNISRKMMQIANAMNLGRVTITGLTPEVVNQYLSTMQY